MVKSIRTNGRSSNLKHTFQGPSASQSVLKIILEARFSGRSSHPHFNEGEVEAQELLGTFLGQATAKQYCLAAGYLFKGSWVISGQSCGRLLVGADVQLWQGGGRMC